MRLVYLLESTEPWGGVRTVFEHADRLTALGHRVEVLSKGEAPTWFSLRAPFRRVSAFTPDVIPDADAVIGTYWTTVPYAWAAGRGLPLHFCQGYEGDLYPDGLLRREILARYRLPPHLVPSEETCIRLRAEIEAVYRLPTVKVTVGPHLKHLIETRFGRPCDDVGHGIDLGRFGAGPVRSCETGRRVLVVGPWEWPVKGIADALEGLGRIKPRWPDLRVIRASQLPQCEAERALGVVDEYHDGVHPDRMPALYRGCDLLVSASMEAEGFGLAAVEAMACGLPCVLTAIPAYRSLSGGRDCALFVPPRDPGAIADAVSVLLSNREAWRRLRLAGLEVAAEHPIEAVVARLERLLLRLFGPQDVRAADR